MHGFIKAKERGSIPFTKTCGLLPQTVLLNILNRMVMAKISVLLDRYSISSGVKQFINGGSKGSQPQDISFTASQVLEKVGIGIMLQLSLKQMWKSFTTASHGDLHIPLCCQVRFQQVGQERP